MIFSAQSIFSDDQAITATAASTNTIDLQATGTVYGAAAAISRDIGPGTAIDFLAQVTEDFNTLTSLAIALQVDDNSSFSSATTVFTHSVVLADLTAGYKLPFIYVPLNVNERYVRMNYTVTGTNPTTGKITSGIVMGVQTNA